MTAHPGMTVADQARKVVPPTPSTRRVLAIAEGLPEFDADWTLTSARHVADAVRPGACLMPDAIVLDEALVDGLDDALALRRAYADAPIVLIGCDAPNRLLRRVSREVVERRELTGSMLTRCLDHAFERQQLRREADRARLRIQQLADDLRSARTKLRDSANIDSLTDLLNRRGLHAGLARAVEFGASEGGLLAMMLDLDGFKAINERLGDASGNVVLREIGKRIRDALRDQDCAARLGADEFLVVLPNTPWSDGLRIADRIRLSVSSSPVLEAQGPISITASVGIAYIPDVRSQIDDILEVTRIALARSKQAGRNCVGFHGGLGEVFVSNRIEGECAEAIDALRDGRGLYAARHEIVDLADERVVGFEYLSRSSLPVFEGPTDFFRVATEAGSLAAVDERCFELCAEAGSRATIGEWHHLNVYPSTLMEVDPHRLVEAIPPEMRSRFCIEINEQQILGDPSELLEAVQVFREAGIRIAMDDVGFGRSCMESLILLEPDVVKIDRTFVTGVAESPRRMHSLKRLLCLLDSLGATVIAEGIETQQDREALMELGVRYGQGFLWGAPSAVEDSMMHVA